jgi:hypothetical protein
MTKMLDAVSIGGRRQLLLFAVRRPWCTTKKVYIACLSKAHGKGTLPCKILLCALCRARPLSWASTKNTRQTLCCAFSSLFRAPETHGEARISRSGLRCASEILPISSH